MSKSNSMTHKRNKKMENKQKRNFKHMTILIEALKTLDKIKQPSANFKNINTLSKEGIETSLNIKKGTWK